MSERPGTCRCSSSPPAPLHGRGEHESCEGERDAGCGDAEAEAPRVMFCWNHTMSKPETIMAKSTQM
nr:unnamed protein product [Digitaria exilis]